MAHSFAPARDLHEPLWERRRLPGRLRFASRVPLAGEDARAHRFVAPDALIPEAGEPSGPLGRAVLAVVQGINV